MHLLVVALAFWPHPLSNESLPPPRHWKRLARSMGGETVGKRDASGGYVMSGVLSL